MSFFWIFNLNYLWKIRKNVAKLAIIHRSLKGRMTSKSLECKTFRTVQSSFGTSLLQKRKKKKIKCNQPTNKPLNNNTKKPRRKLKEINVSDHYDSGVWLSSSGFTLSLRLTRLVFSKYCMASHFARAHACWKHQSTIQLFSGPVFWLCCALWCPQVITGIRPPGSYLRDWNCI